MGTSMNRRHFLGSLAAVPAVAAANQIGPAVPEASTIPPAGRVTPTARPNVFCLTVVF